MSDRFHTLTVALDRDYREDDVKAIVDAIAMIRGVSAVALGEPLDSRDWSARMRVRHEMADRFRQLHHDLLDAP